jgi:hypothetical protein
MRGFMEILTAVSLVDLFPAFAFSHSVYSENITDVPFGGLYGIVACDDKNRTKDRSKRDEDRFK